MQSSDQQPAEEPQQEPVEEAVEQQAIQPLYEFPPEIPSSTAVAQAAPVTRVLPEGAPQQLPIDEAVKQGLLYPPPPSYYQALPTATQSSALEAQNRPQPVSPSAYAPPYAATPYQAPPAYPPPGSMPYIQPPPVKKSYRWLWLVIGLLSVLILASCGICGWAFFTIFSSAYQQVSGSVQVVNDYYSNLQAKNYAAAYSDLSPQGQISGLTQQQFSDQAARLDEQYGAVTSFVLGQPSIGTNPSAGTDLSHFTIMVDVKRPRLSYTVLLTLSKIGSTWKITEYDRL